MNFHTQVETGNNIQREICSQILRETTHLLNGWNFNINDPKGKGTLFAKQRVRARGKNEGKEANRQKKIYEFKKHNNWTTNKQIKQNCKERKKESMETPFKADWAKDTFQENNLVIDSKKTNLIVFHRIDRT